MASRGYSFVIFVVIFVGFTGYIMSQAGMDSLIEGDITIKNPEDIDACNDAGWFGDIPILSDGDCMLQLMWQNMAQIVSLSSSNPILGVIFSGITIGLIYITLDSLLG